MDFIHFIRPTYSRVALWITAFIQGWWWGWSAWTGAQMLRIQAVHRCVWMTHAVLEAHRRERGDAPVSVSECTSITQRPFPNGQVLIGGPKGSISIEAGGKPSWAKLGLHRKFCRRLTYAGQSENNVLWYMCPIVGIFAIAYSSLVSIIAFRSKEFENRWHICHVGIIRSGSHWHMQQWMPAWASQLVLWVSISKILLRSLGFIECCIGKLSSRMH